MNNGSLLALHARYRGNHPVVVVGDHRLSFGAFNAYVNRLANALLAAGLSKGDKLTTLLPICLELLAAYWAAAKTGGLRLIDEPCAYVPARLPQVDHRAGGILHRGHAPDIHDVERTQQNVPCG